MTRELTHERCAHRCCCDSWSCEPHRADCSTVERRSWARVSTWTSEPVLSVPLVTDLRGRPIEDAA